MTKNNFLIFYILLTFFLIIKINFLVNYTTSSDLFNFMYFGQELLKGKKVWVYEFEDKLPIVQFLFLIPAYFKNLSFWYIISSIFCLISTFFVYIFSKYYLKELKIKNYDYQLSLLISLIYLTLNLSFYDSIKHINTIALNLFIIGFCLIAFELSKNLKWRVVAIFLMAMSVSVRPYFLGPIFFTFLYLSLINPINLKRKIGVIISLSKDCAIFGISILLINFIFYWDEINNVFAALEIINLMGSKINFYENFKIHVYNIFFSSKEHAIIFIVSFIFALKVIVNFNSYEYNDKLFVIFFLILSPISLFYTITSREIHIHYIIFYVPFLFFILLIYLKYYIGNIDILLKFLSIIFFILIFINLKYPYPQQDIDLKDKDLKDIDLKEISFFSPFNISIHYQFNQDRYGFPNAAISEMIFNDEFKEAFIDFNNRGDFYFPVTSEEYCKILNISEIPYIILTSKRENILFSNCDGFLDKYDENKINNMIVYKIKK